MRTVRGLQGKAWHLVELDEPLPAAFDPLRALPADWGDAALTHLLLAPPPQAPPDETPDDPIRERLDRGDAAPVAVSAIRDAADVPDEVRDPSDERFPYLCGGRVRPAR